MENLWAAWRRDFILGPKEKGCVFCNRIKEQSDKNNLILFRGKKSFIIMNKYPYNSGHLMIIPKSHRGDLEELTDFEWHEMNKLVRKSVTILKKVMPADGFNIGMNLGAVAGAGIKDHVHIHVLPRFTGDTNFTASIGKARVQSISLEDIYDLLIPHFKKLKSKS